MIMSLEHKTYLPDSFEFSQRQLLDKLVTYCSENQRHPELIARLGGPGYCSGIASVVLYALWLQLQPKQNESVQRDDFTWFQKVVETLMSLTSEQLKKLDKNGDGKQINDVERLLYLIEYFQTVEEYVPIGQGELQTSFADTRKRELHKHYSMGGVFKQEDFFKEIKTSKNKLTIFDALIPEGMFVLISSHNHDTGILKIKGQYYFVDPNLGLKKFNSNEEEKLVEAIYTSNFTGHTNKPSPLAFRIFSFDKSPSFQFVPEIQILSLLNNTSAHDFAHANRFSGIHRSAWVGSLASVEYFLKTTDVNAKTAGGFTALTLAAGQGHLNIVHTLLKDEKLQIDIADNQKGHTALLEAVDKNHYEVVGALLDAKANINFITEKQHMTALHLAAKKGFVEIMQLLLKHGARLDLKNKKNLVPLDLAKEFNQPAAVNLLLAYQFREKSFTETIDEKKNTTLHLAAKYNSEYFLKTILEEKGIDVNVKNADGKTPLDIAAKEYSFTASKVLLEYYFKQGGLNSKYRDINENTPIHLATKYRAITLIKPWFEKKIDINAFNNKHQTALHIAVSETRDSQILKQLLAHNADKELADREGNTPLHLAVQYGNLFYAEPLLESKSNVNAVNQEGLSPLHILIKNALTDLQVANYLKYNPDMTLEDKNGDTPLHLAVRMKKSKIVKLLLEAKANPELVNNKNSTPLQVAQDNELRALLQFKTISAKEGVWLKQQITQLSEKIMQEEKPYGSQAESLKKEIMSVLEDKNIPAEQQFFLAIKKLQAKLLVPPSSMGTEIKSTLFSQIAPSQSIFYGCIAAILMEVNNKLSRTPLKLPDQSFKKINDFPTPISDEAMQLKL